MDGKIPSQINQPRILVLASSPTITTGSRIVSPVASHNVYAKHTHKMPSVKNPNKPSKNRLAAWASKAKKRAQKSSVAGTRSAISNRDAQRGAKPGLLPTSGPRAALSAKKQKKMEQRARLALKRKLEAEGGSGEIEMAGEFPFGCTLRSSRRPTTGTPFD